MSSISQRSALDSVRKLASLMPTLSGPIASYPIPIFVPRQRRRSWKPKRSAGVSGEERAGAWSKPCAAWRRCDGRLAQPPVRPGRDHQEGRHPHRRRRHPRLADLADRPAGAGIISTKCACRRREPLGHVACFSCASTAASCEPVALTLFRVWSGRPRRRSLTVAATCQPCRARRAT